MVDVYHDISVVVAKFVVVIACSITEKPSYLLLLI